MKKTYFTIADNNNLKYYEMLKNSLSEFSDENLTLIDEEKVKQLGDPHFYYRAAPIVAKGLLQRYNAVCKVDADTIITGNLDEIWEGDFDVAVVRNSNPREDNKNPIRLLDIHPFSYVNAGFVVLKSREFVDHWLGLCMSKHFLNFQYREQDLLNIMIFYMNQDFGGPYKVKFLDDGDSFYGLASKGYWPNIQLKDKKLVLPPTTDSFGIYPDKEKQIKAIHWAGGSGTDKMNLRLHFKPEVVKFLEGLIKDDK